MKSTLYGLARKSLRDLERAHVIVHRKGLGFASVPLNECDDSAGECVAAGGSSP